MEEVEGERLHLKRVAALDIGKATPAHARGRGVKSPLGMKVLTHARTASSRQTADPRGTLTDLKRFSVFNIIAERTHPGRGNTESRHSSQHQLANQSNATPRLSPGKTVANSYAALASVGGNLCVIRPSTSKRAVLTSLKKS